MSENFTVLIEQAEKGLADRLEALFTDVSIRQEKVAKHLKCIATIYDKENRCRVTVRVTIFGIPLTAID